MCQHPPWLREGRLGLPIGWRWYSPQVGRIAQASVERADTQAVRVLRATEQRSGRRTCSVRAAVTRRLGLPVGLLLFATILLLPATAEALTYSDVGSTQWAGVSIDWVTDQVRGTRRPLDDFGGRLFRPATALKRSQFARALVLASGKQDITYVARDLVDVTPDHPYYADIQRALKLGLLGTYSGGRFKPDEPVLVWQAHRALVKMIRAQHPSPAWAMLTRLDPANWRPNEGWKTPAPSYFAYEVAARYLGLRYNHPSSQDALERFPEEALRRDQAAYAFYQAMHVSAWQVSSLASFSSVVLPPLSDRQKEIIGFALRWEGYPHIYGGEYPTVSSPYGTQAHGGFDCSGFTWWVLKMSFGYPIPDSQRTAAAMAGGARPRITRANLKPGDLIFWGPNGSDSAATSIYHAGIYIGNGWFIHSTGSSAGVSLASLDWDGWSWKTDFAWGRRVLTAADLALPSPSPSGGVALPASGSAQ